MLGRKAMVFALAACLSVQSIGFGATFSDIEGHWAKANLEKIHQQGLMNGFEGKMSPNAPLTRAEMAAIINRAFGATKMGEISYFEDLDPKSWTYEEMAKAVYMGTFKGDGKSLSPNAPITREQVALVLTRAFKYQLGDLRALEAFEDVHEISTYAAPSMATLVSLGILKGNEGKLSPKKPITRAEFASLMTRLVHTYIDAAGIYSGTYYGNVVVRHSGVVFENAIIKGDLILADGIGDNTFALDGVTVTGRIVIRSASIAAELGLIDEDIALGRPNQPTTPEPALPVASPTPSPTTPLPTTPVTPTPTPEEAALKETMNKLGAVQTTLNQFVVDKLETSLQREAMGVILDAIASFVNDSSYDISADVAYAKSIGRQMTPEEYNAFKNTITRNVPLAELVTLNNYFQLIEY